MKILIEMQGHRNKVTDKYNSVEELIGAAIDGFVDVGDDEYVNLDHALSINVVEKRSTR